MGTHSTAWMRCTCTLRWFWKRGSSSALAVPTGCPVVTTWPMMLVETALRTSSSSTSVKPTAREKPGVPPGSA
jgi:hypothetical protein